MAPRFHPKSAPLGPTSPCLWTHSPAIVPPKQPPSPKSTTGHPLACDSPWQLPPALEAGWILGTPGGNSDLPQESEGARLLPLGRDQGRLSVLLPASGPPHMLGPPIPFGPGDMEAPISVSTIATPQGSLFRHRLQAVLQFGSHSGQLAFLAICLRGAARAPCSSPSL